MLDTEALRSLSESEFNALGANHYVYVRPVTVEGIVQYSVYNANGQQIFTAPNYETAVAAAMQHDLEPVSIH